MWINTGNLNAAHQKERLAVISNTQEIFTNPNFRLFLWLLVVCTFV